MNMSVNNIPENQPTQIATPLSRNREENKDQIGALVALVHVIETLQETEAAPTIHRGSGPVGPIVPIHRQVPPTESAPAIHRGSGPVGPIVPVHRQVPPTESVL